MVIKQKIIQIGNSLGVTLPSEFVKSRKIKAGQVIFMDADSDLDLVQMRTATGQFSALTPEFKDWLDTVSTEHIETIKELAKK